MLKFTLFNFLSLLFRVSKIFLRKFYSGGIVLDRNNSVLFSFLRRLQINLRASNTSSRELLVSSSPINFVRSHFVMEVICIRAL